MRLRQVFMDILGWVRLPANPPISLPSVHPGHTLKGEMEARNLTATVLAIGLNVPTNRITEIIHCERGISAETALRLGRYFGNGAQFWHNLQCNYELAVALETKGEQILREVEPA
jgi:addiction module HigA family antidote